MAVRTVTIVLDPGTPILGIWCNACMTSGGFIVPLSRICRHGVTPMVKAAGCLTCGGRGDLELTG